MKKNKKSIIALFIALIMILSPSMTFAYSSPGTIHLYLSEETTNGNETKFAGQESIYVGVENFTPGIYPVTVQSPGRNGTILGSGEISVGEGGSMVFNLYEVTKFMPTDNKAGLYTVVVGDNKTKNFTLDYVEIKPDTWDVRFEAGPYGSLSGTVVFADILDGTNWDHAVTVPTAVPDPGYQFDGWDRDFPETIEQDWTFTALFSLKPVDPEPTPQDIRADLLIGEGFIPIATPAELSKMRNSYPDGELFGVGTRWEKDYVTTGLSGKYVLVRDIDLSAEGNWVPVGTISDPFTGVFDGNDYEIIHLTSRYGDDISFVGLFGSVQNGLIRYLDLTGPVVSGGEGVGAMAGSILNSNLMNIRILESANDMHNDGIYGTSRVGGLVGYSESSIIEHVVNKIAISGNNIGGIAGEQDEASSISDAINEGAISGLFTAGGITGMNYGDIIRALNQGPVMGDGFVGGITGGSFYGILNETVISQVVNTGYVRGIQYAGGIAGFIEFASISDGFNTGTIEGISSGEIPGEGLSNAGGISGFANRSTFNNVYNSSRIITTSIGMSEIVGYMQDADLTNGFYNKDQNNTSQAWYGVALDNVQMTDETSFTGFDFADVWAIDAGETYPYLTWHSSFYKPLKSALP